MENIVNSTIALYKAYRKTRCGKREQIAGGFVLYTVAVGVCDDDCDKASCIAGNRKGELRGKCRIEVGKESAACKRKKDERDNAARACDRADSSNVCMRSSHEAKL